MSDEVIVRLVLILFVALVLLGHAIASRVRGFMRGWWDNG